MELLRGLYWARRKEQKSISDRRDSGVSLALLTRDTTFTPNTPGEVSNALSSRYARKREKKYKKWELRDASGSGVPTPLPSSSHGVFFFFFFSLLRTAALGVAHRSDKRGLT